jgi:hypothetical protein
VEVEHFLSSQRAFDQNRRGRNELKQINTDAGSMDQEIYISIYIAGF